MQARAQRMVGRVEALRMVQSAAKHFSRGLEVPGGMMYVAQHVQQQHLRAVIAVDGRIGQCGLQRRVGLTVAAQVEQSTPDQSIDERIVGRRAGRSGILQ